MWREAHATTMWIARVRLCAMAICKSVVIRHLIIQPTTNSVALVEGSAKRWRETVTMTTSVQGHWNVALTTAGVAMAGIGIAALNQVM